VELKSELMSGVQVTDFIGDLHCTIVNKLVKCSDDVDHHHLPANVTTCPEVKTLSVRARGVPLVSSLGDAKSSLGDAKRLAG
jgi:hypothetical protein